MKVQKKQSSFVLHQGDCLDILRTIPDNSIDSVVTDPPYGLSFLGKRWDYDVPSVDVWAECLRVLKPGGHLLAFAGTRTQHRVAVRIEDAGFEIRDMIAWVYGSGFPKSLDVSKAIEAKILTGGSAPKNIRMRDMGDEYRPHELAGTPGYGDGRMSRGADTDRDYRATPKVTTPGAMQWQGWGTALKPALEPITMARKPLVSTVAENVLTHGTGALNIDGCRVGMEGGLASGACEIVDIGKGRWPANLILDGSEEVLAGFPQTGGGTKRDALTPTTHNAPSKFGYSKDRHQFSYGDTGSAARFFKECNQWQDHDLPRSSADTAPQSLSLQNVLASIVQNAVAIWPSLAGIASSEQKGRSTSVTQSESKAINETAMQAMASIASGFSQESRHERRTPSGTLVKTAATQEPTGTTTITTSLCRSDGSAEAATLIITPSNLDRGDQVSRLNYCAKASKSDRSEGNVHPTVKPTDLMRYLCRLVTPPGGVVLDPFMGSGSTGKAAGLEGFSFVGIEKEQSYVEIAEKRIKPVYDLESDSESTEDDNVAD